jgi:hypothetical protein
MAFILTPKLLCTCMDHWNNFESTAQTRNVFKMLNSYTERVLYLKECPLLRNEEGKLRAPNCQNTALCV